MTKVKEKHFHGIRYGDRLPRKIKKFFLQERISSCELNRKLRTLKLVSKAETMYQLPVFNMDLFCPNCGCEDYYGVDHHVLYPEHWEDFHCMRCRKKVAYIDNSPFIHVLEMDDES